jgi:D-inositol-3-phosphate glycosyltransferase
MPSANLTSRGPRETWPTPFAKGDYPVHPAPYDGPSVFGYETDLPLRRAAQISVHTSPLATLGGKDAGGMNVYIRELACHLADLGLPVDVFTRRVSPDTPEVQPLAPNVNVVAIAAGPPAPIDKNDLVRHLPEFAAEMALFSLRQGVRYDVVHAHYWLSGWAAHLVKRYWDTPFVQMFHTTAHMKNAVAGVADRETDVRLRTEQRLCALADSLIAANPDERADLVWRFGTPAEKVCTIPPGVDLDLFQPRDRTASRAELGIAPDERVILFVGRIDPIKGIDTLLDAVAILAADDDLQPKPTVLLVGGDLDAAGEPIGPLTTVREAARALGVAERFRFLGSQPQNRLPVFYAAADVVVVPSRYESFGLVAVEALACGAPVVASRAGGLKFTIDEGVGGLLVPPQSAPALASALGMVLTDEALRANLAAGARPSVERFAWPTVAAAIEHVYRRLAAGHRAHLCHDDEIFTVSAGD